jgi:hypothetical protein
MSIPNWLQFSTSGMPFEVIRVTHLATLIQGKELCPECRVDLNDNQIVFIPNRTIANVSRFPLGGIHAYADVLLPPGVAPEKAVQIVANIAKGMWVQFGAIILSEPTIGGVETAAGGGWDFIRVRFTIWPGQGTLIETTFRQQMVSAMKTFDPNYADWQVPVTYRAMAAPKTANQPHESAPDKPASWWRFP